MQSSSEENRKSFSFTENQSVVHQHETVVYPRNSYTIKRSYCEIVQKNKPQCNSVVGGEMTVVSILTLDCESRSLNLTLNVTKNSIFFE